MKTKLLLFGLISFFLFSSFITVNEVKPKGENHRVAIWVNSNKLVIVHIDKLDDIRFLKYHLRIENENGLEIYYQNICCKTSVNIGYDLSSLPEGIYTFVVSYKYKQIYSKVVRLGIQDKPMEEHQNPIIVELIKE